MTDRRRIARLAIVPLTTLALLAACAGANQLERRLLEMLPWEGSSASIRVNEVIPAARWERLLILCPYEDPTGHAEAAGIAAAELEGLLVDDDGRQAFVAVADGAVVGHWDLARSRIDLCSDGTWPIIEREDDLVIRLEATGDRLPWVSA